MTEFSSTVLFAADAHAEAPLNYLHASGQKAEAVLGLTWGVLGIAVTVIIVIALLLCAAIWRRPGLPSPAPGEQMALSRSMSGLNWLWIGVSISSIALLISVIWTMRVLANIAHPFAPPAVSIEVTAHQWWWQVRYLNDDASQIFTTANEIHVPAGAPVHVKLVGADVIHSFWVPALTGKTDVIPGQTSELWMDARSPGIYRGQCTEYCGVEHAHMSLLVIAQKPKDFENWRTHQLQTQNGTLSGLVERGQADFTTHCGSCHTVRGTDAAGILGPDLSHLMTRKMIAAGTLPNDGEHLLEWISDPQAIKPGALMQKPQLNSDDLKAVYAYLQTLN